MKIAISITVEELANLDEFAAGLGVSRSAAVVRAVGMAKAAPTMDDLKRLFAEQVLELTQKRVGTHPVLLVGDEVVKMPDPAADAGLVDFFAKQGKVAPAEVARAPRPASGDARG